MSIKLALIYYSATSTTYQMALAFEKEAKAAGAEVRLRKVKELAPEEAIAQNEKWAQHIKDTKNVKEATLEDLEWADAIVLASPTRYGMPAAQLKQFIDMTGPLWAEGKLVDKIASSFTTTATAHGGQETTILAINNTFYHWGCIIVSPGYTDESQFVSGNPYGASFTSENGKLDPDKMALKALSVHAKRVVEVTKRWVGK
ncbi:NAD(P)H:quinone oxidoreductase [soil metagenome]